MTKRALVTGVTGQDGAYCTAIWPILSRLRIVAEIAKAFGAVFRRAARR